MEAKLNEVCYNVIGFLFVNKPKIYIHYANLSLVGWNKQIPPCLTLASVKSGRMVTMSLEQFYKYLLSVSTCPAIDMLHLVQSKDRHRE